jgi:hypothetical protein
MNNPSSANMAMNIPHGIFMPRSRQKRAMAERPPARPSVVRCDIEPVITSAYEVDDFGMPRIVPQWMGGFYLLGWPLVAGVVLGYLLLIFVAAQPVNSARVQGHAGRVPTAFHEASR